MIKEKNKTQSMPKRKKKKGEKEKRRQKLSDHEEVLPPYHVQTMQQLQELFLLGPMSQGEP